MKEFIEKLLSRLYTLRDAEIDNLCNSDEEETADDGEQIFESGRSQGRYEQANRIIKIVNQLVEEYNNDFCEWKGEDMLGLYNSSCRQKSIVNPFWAHCPYCGKKIKVVK